MTRQKTFKRRIRERMERTGESYVSARAALIDDEPPGTHPETTALRFALQEAGLEISEALALIIAGGAGAACMSFHYEADDFTHFHLSGWNPFQSDIRAAIMRLNLTPDVHETGGAKAAEKALRERLETRVQIAWVDQGTLSGLPDDQTGGGYHVIVVLALDDDSARIHDGTPQTVTTERLAAARGRIRKDKHRLLAVGDGEPDIAAAVRDGLEACARGPAKPPTPGMSLDGIARWADDLERGWPKFPAGKHRDGVLHDMAAAVRGQGGLLRHLQAKGLHEAADVLALEPLHDVAKRTARLATTWDAPAAETDLRQLASRARALHAQEVETRESLRALLL